MSGKKKGSPIPFTEEVYTKIDIKRLIIYGIYSICKKGETCTFERLVAECFQNFPKVFGFKRYPNWPDSLRFDRPIRTLREEGLVVGTVKDRLELTEFGEKMAIETESFLKNRISPNRMAKTALRSIDDKIIEYIKESEPFKKFVSKGENSDISDAELRSLLRCTLETPQRIVKQNLAYYLNVATLYKEREIINFLSFCKKKLFKREG